MKNDATTAHKPQGGVLGVGVADSHVQDTQGTETAHTHAVDIDALTNFADWLFARCGAVRHYRQPPVIQDGERAAWEFWQAKQRKQMQAGGK